MTSVENRTHMAKRKKDKQLTSGQHNGHININKAGGINVLPNDKEFLFH
jgi:hypothetical protein